jgi:hypothetical protein
LSAFSLAIRRLVNEQELDDTRKPDNILAPVDPDEQPVKVEELRELRIACGTDRGFGSNSIDCLERSTHESIDVTHGATLMSITTPAVVSWLFAGWWLVTGFLDFNVIRYDAAGSTRYRKTLPLLLSVFAGSALVVLGYAFASDQRSLILPSLGIFAAIWVLWSLVAKRSWRKE